ncbi:MAG: hypothetical protein JWQ36_2239 [Enterovirga sp.]|jgi:hypothetical protein|nr:hypothetical protein [Enterovirga sp.]
MSGYDGQVGAGSIAGGGFDLLRTVCNGRTGVQIVFGNTQETLSGAVLDLSRGGEDARIVLVDAAGTAAMTFGPFPEEEVIAIWRSMVAASGLTPMIRAWDGYTEPLASQMGKLRLGRAQDSKRLIVLSGRRPRFLVRRKSARLPVRPLVFRGREIACGREA